jgi:hypothetical protein
MITRLQFLRSLGALGLAAVTAPMLVACKKEDDPTPDAGNNNNPDASMGGSPDAKPDSGMQPPTCNTLTSSIGSNHGHVLTLPPADVTAGVEKTYNIQGSSNHPHTVKVTAQNFAMLKQTGTITLTSEPDNIHPHSVTITCG